MPRLRRGYALLLAAGLLLGGHLVAGADGGVRSASISNVTLGGLMYSHDAQARAGTLYLSVDDFSGEAAGWNVTVQASNFDYSGFNNGSDIPASGFAITAAGSPHYIGGQAIDPSYGPQAAPGATGALHVARKVLQAGVGYGQGSYTQELDVLLQVPARSRAGSYTSTLTVTIAAGP